VGEIMLERALETLPAHDPARADLTELQAAPEVRSRWRTGLVAAQQAGAGGGDGGGMAEA
jgi:hypothetical protein